MAITPAEVTVGHAPPVGATAFAGKKPGRRVMVDVFAVAFLSVALGVPALILATMLGSNLNLD
jgi:hypothetical protein